MFFILFLLAKIDKAFDKVDDQIRKGILPPQKGGETVKMVFSVCSEAHDS